MLEMRPGCECCDRDLPPDSADARICTFECTFCVDCTRKLRGICPNCGGELVHRPIRPVGEAGKVPGFDEASVQAGGLRATTGPPPRRSLGRKRTRRVVKRAGSSPGSLGPRPSG